MNSPVAARVIGDGLAHETRKEEAVNLHHVRYEKRDGIATVTLNRPEVLNALNANTITDLEHIVHDAHADDSVRVVIVTGEGDKAFAAGADIAELASHTAPTGQAMAERGQRVLRFLETMGKPSVASVNGYALGGGCELAMACSIRIASDKARFGQPEINLGIIPGYAGSQRLPRLVGKGVAMDLVLTGRIIDAAEALRIGLVTRVVSHAELAAESRALAEELREKAPLALRAAIDVVDRGYDMTIDDANDLEAAHFGVLCATDDMREGTKAFLEKRKPSFKGQ